MLDKQAYADAAPRFIDEHGFDAISMRSLGQYMGRRRFKWVRDKVSLSN